MRRVVVLLLCLTSAGSAGCADEAPTDTPPVVIDQNEFELAAGKGAIAGLLVDDRFRPIQLTDEPETEFQTTGFVLLQETGQQVQTTENGEFAFVDLEPGRYTIRVTAVGHEVTPKGVDVEAGVFNEANVVARRVNSQGSFIVTQEYAAFIPCAVQVMAETAIADCTFDASGDSSRTQFVVDYSALGANVTLMKTEMRANQIGDYGLQIGWGDPSSLDYGYYEIWDDFDTDYSTATLVYNQTGNSSISFAGIPVPIDPWLNDRPMTTTMFLYGEFSQEARAVGLYPFTGLGVDLGVKARFLHSLFIGPPEVDVEAYCVLCTA